MVVEIRDRFGVGDHEGQFTAPFDGGAGNPLGLPTIRTAPPFETSHPADRAIWSV